jgi:3-hydroxyisobutyrate dehydrogenase-like beta-hydroxyacid dehydrogenase
MENSLALIGFGEAAAAFCAVGQRAFDIKTDDQATREAKLADYRANGVVACDSAAAALAGASAVLSLVTADRALEAAMAGAPHLAPDTLWIDMNSVAPGTKKAAARAIEAAGGRYADAAVMAPVDPARRDVPILLSGPYAEAALRALAGAGFGDVHIVDGPVGAAAAIKMIRSVMVKGLEALTTECAMAAEAAGVRGEVFASLDASWRAEQNWQDRAAYNLERMLRHGGRRAAEMEEAVKTLDALGVASEMSRATRESQREIGRLGASASAGLADRIDAILGRRRDRAA